MDIHDIGKLTHKRLDSFEGIDEEVEEVLKYLHQLKALRNSQAPINARLPPEILCEIFLHLAQGYHDDFYFYEPNATREDLSNACHSSAKPYSWLPQVNICRHWREIAIQLPQLWAVVPAQQCGQITTAFQRAAALPLEIRLPRPVLHFDPIYGLSDRRKHKILSHDAYKQIFSQVHRTRWLELDLDRTVIGDTWSEVQESLSNAPLLEVLRLEGSLQRFPDYPPPPKLALQRLRWLEIHCLTTSTMRALISPSLTRLVLSQVEELMSVAEWLTILSELPSLEVLDLEDVFESRNRLDPLPGTFQQTRISSLQFLRVCETRNTSAATLADFLRRIIVPSSTKVFFDGAELNPSRPSYADILDSLATLVSNNDTHTGNASIRACRTRGVRTRADNYAYTRHAVFELWDTPYSVHDISNFDNPTAGLEKPRLLISVDHSAEEAALLYFLLAFQRVIPQLQTLHVHVYEQLAEWYGTHGLQEVRGLSVQVSDEHDVEVLFGALIPSPTLCEGSNMLVWEPLHIDTLILRCSGPTAFATDEAACSSRHEYIPSCRGPSLCRLYEVLRAQRNAGAPLLKHLRIDNCDPLWHEQLAAFERDVIAEGLLETFEWN